VPTWSLKDHISLSSTDDEEEGSQYELIKGFEYTKASGRVNFIASVDFASNSGQATRYLGKLHHFLLIPHPRNDPNDPNMAHLNSHGNLLSAPSGHAWESKARWSRHQWQSLHTYDQSKD
jgi:hypothetical protein